MIAIENFKRIAEEAGVKMKPLSAYYKIEVGSRRVYVARTHSVTRVDLSGFHFTHPAVRVLSPEYRYENRFGAVEAQLDFSKREELVLEAFATAIAFMQALAGEEVDLSDDMKEQVEWARNNPPQRRRPTRRGAAPQTYVASSEHDQHQQA